VDGRAVVTYIGSCQRLPAHATRHRLHV